MSDTFAQGYALIVGVGADLPDTGEQATVANIRAVLETLAPGDTVARLSNLMNHLGKAVPESARTLCQAEQTQFFDATTDELARLRAESKIDTGS